jgi:hypothetical protein
MARLKPSRRAEQAFNDYESMGNARSLPGLLERYQSADNPPTRRLVTLAKWSVAFSWEARVAGPLAQERKQQEAQIQAECAKVLSAGVALALERVRTLKKVAGQESELIQEALRCIEIDEGCENLRLGRRYAILKRSFHRTLRALAAETAGRPTQRHITRDLISYARQWAREHGSDEAVAVEIAKQVAEERRSEF